VARNKSPTYFNRPAVRLKGSVYPTLIPLTLKSTSQEIIRERVCQQVWKYKSIALNILFIVYFSLICSNRVYSVE
jgi:hypothetical protein